jgi:alpha-D-ribose 1-methylphosphonate 5-triphosphate diphosphatase PhnM
MTIWWLILILAFIASSGLAFVWLAVRINSLSSTTKRKTDLTDSIEATAKKDVEHIFNDDFRQELRNRGRLNFEKIINENANFLQQDLRLTISQIDEYLKNQINTTLKEDFTKYEQSIEEAKTLAMETIKKTSQALEEQRTQISSEVQKEVEEVKQLFLERFENNMADIINHYVLTVMGDQIDLDNQMEYILAGLEANKKAIIEDIKNGA